jgi:hypothetical protein
MEYTIREGFGAMAYNVMNTVIVDHKGFRVGCNALGNVIITMPFHIHSLEKLGETI